MRSNGHATLGRAEEHDGGDRVSGDIQPVLDELERKGIILRDPARGSSTSRPCTSEGSVHLCWQLGEDDLGWWHFPDEGFAGRQPLPLPEEW